MSGAKEIKSKINSIKSTQKITRAMEMVAASKMRKAQNRMQGSRPYTARIRQVISHLLQGRLEVSHPFLEPRPVKSIVTLVISSDRGLCGGLNANLFRAILNKTREWEIAGIDSKICTFGRKAQSFFSKYTIENYAHIDGVGDQPVVSDLIGLVKVVEDLFLEQQVDAVFLAYNHFVNTMTQKPIVEQLLPIANNEKITESWDYLYEPEPQALLDQLLKRYLEALVYQATVENLACEQAARMVAMKSASDNATDLIAEFQLIYNKARQAAITQELSEIVAGAAAV